MRPLHIAFGFLFVVILSLQSAPSTLPEDIISQIDALIDTEMQEKNLPSLIVGIWIPGEGEYTVAKGYANLETLEPRTTEQPFRIASITKTFTGLVVLTLIDDGLLEWDNTIDKWYPDFPNADLITIQNLLEMRSGIVDYASHDFLHKIYQNTLLEFTFDELLEFSANKSSLFESPDQKSEYCNMNFTMLGDIVEKVTGDSLGQVIQDRISTPLGLTNTIYATDEQLPGDLRGYSWNAASNQYEDKTEVMSGSWANGAGAMISTLQDMKVYAKALYQGVLLSSETHAKQLDANAFDGNPEWIRYGSGILDLGGFWGHNGTIFGFSSEMFYYPPKDAVIIININRLDEDDISMSTNFFLKLAPILFPGSAPWDSQSQAKHWAAY